MPNAQLAFAAKDVALDVRDFVVSDGMSQLFDVQVTAVASDESIDLDAVVGHGAAFRLAKTDQTYVAWAGVCRSMEQIGVEEEGVSLYRLHIVPMLWRAGLRENYRIFQHQTAAELASTLLADWGIEPDLRLDGADDARHEYRVQYGETDLGFLMRQLEEAGVSYHFVQVDPKGEGELDTTSLVLSDRPGRGPRRKDPIAYRGRRDQQGGGPYVSDVRLSRSLAPGSFAVGGYDFRSSQQLQLMAEADLRQGDEESRYQFYRYQPGAFLTERGARQAVVVDERQGQAVASRELERLRSESRCVGLVTNDFDLAPGTVFAMQGHPRADLSAERPLLVVRRCLRGAHDGEWTADVECVPADQPYRPQAITPKPRVMGLHSAVVTGARDDAASEIHTDEYGRVRVQFHWDRYGQNDDRSSCWIRVARPWAGADFGFHHVPRVGNEVLVDFFQGDPDRPVIVGSVHNRGTAIVESLPQAKTKSTWRSQSTPGGNGYNEISFDDASGEELVHVRAERDFEKVVRRDARTTIGRERQLTIRDAAQKIVGADETITVRGQRSVEVQGELTQRSATSLLSQAGATTGVSISEGRLVLSNGTASIVLDGPNVTIDGAANVRLSAGRIMQVYGQRVDIDGTPEVRINCGEPIAPAPVPLVPAVPSDTPRGRERTRSVERQRPPGQRRPRRPGRVEEAEFDPQRELDALIRQRLPSLALAPIRLRLPPALNEQLAGLHRISRKANVVKARLLDPETYEAIRDRAEQRLALEQQRLERLAGDLHQTFERQRDHVEDLGKRLEHRLVEEQGNLAHVNDELGAVFSGDKGDLLASGQALIHLFNEQRGRVMSLRKDITSMIERETQYVERFIGEWKEQAEQVKEYLQGFEDLVNDPKDELLDLVLGPNKELARDVQALADEFGYGDEVGEFFGLGPDEAPARTPGRRPRRPGRSPAGRPAGGRPGAGRPGAGRPGAGRRDGGRPDGGRPGRGGGSADAGGAGGRGDEASGRHAAGRSTGDHGTSAAPGQHRAGDELSPTRPGAALGDAPGGRSTIALRGVGNSVTRSGGLAAGDVSQAVGADGFGFLQSAKEGQMMVVATEGASPIDPQALSSKLVDAQMDGRPVAGALSGELETKGYAVYTREWGDYLGEMTRAGQKAAQKA